jgi:hypothetical protein
MDAQFVIKLTQCSIAEILTVNVILLDSFFSVGAGIGTSAFMNGYFTPVMEIEYEDDSSENLKLNYPKSYLFNGD